MMTINAPSPFSKKLQLQIEVAQEGYFTLQGFTADGVALEADALISSLFFNYEENVYGLLSNRTDSTVEVSSSELLDIVSPRYQHPFIEWHGKNTESNNWLEKSQFCKRIGKNQNFGHTPI